LSEILDQPAALTESAYTDGLQAPGVGTWTLDSAHSPHPASRFYAGVLPEAFRLGFSSTFSRYGSLLDHLAVGFVKGFVYLQARAVGAPPDAVGHPPREVFERILAESPELRERCLTAEAVWTERRWRADLERWDTQVKPELVRHRDLLDAVDLQALDDQGLVEHVGVCHEAVAEGWVQHHAHNGAALLPVGDFLVHAGMWTHRPPGELLAALAGCSPVSEGGGAEMEALAAAVAADPAARGLLTEQTLAPAAALALLSAHSAPVTAALAAYARVAAYLPVDGPDAIGVPTTMEEPGLVLGRLRAAVTAHDAGGSTGQAAALGVAAADALRALVPAEFQAEFDDLLGEARLVYRLRDERAVYGDRGFGCVARRALLEVGRRLTARGLLDGVSHAVDLDLAEVAALLLTGEGPSAADVAERVWWRANADYRLMPPLFGPPPGPPPPAEWLPEAAARVHRALGFALEAVLGDSGSATEVGAGPVEVRGIPAGAGVREGRARVVNSPSDLYRIEEGDVLVATNTGPAFNLVLPLLAGMVTDRGGLLSHAAIVAREFSLPAVVGCVDATTRIPDGARVRIDGAAGTVTVLA
jgi:phosphohistidine swiveling domain-containing protein